MTCKSNERVALNISSTKKFIEENGIATVKADKTRAAPHVDELLYSLQQGGAIPFYAVFRPGDPYRPIVLDGLLTPSRVREVLEQSKLGKDSQTTPAARVSVRP